MPPAKRTQSQADTSAADETTTTNVVDPRNDTDDDQRPDQPITVEPANGADQVPPTPDFTQQAAQAAANAQASTVKTEGWEVGNTAPGDKYAPMGADGQPMLDKVQDEPVEGYGVQLVAKGDVIDQAAYDRINATS